MLAEELNFVREELNFATEQLYCSLTTPCVLEQLELDGQVFFGVLAEVVDEFDGLGRELVDVVVELLVGEQLAGGALAALDAGDDVVDAFGGGVEAGDGGAGVVVDGLVGEQLAGRAAPLAEVVDDEVDVVHRAVEAGDGPARLVVDGVVGEELAGGAAPLLEALGDLLERAADLVQVVVERGVVDEAAGRALAGLNLADQLVHVAHGRVEVVVERLVVDELADGALALVDLRRNLGELLREVVELIHEARARLRELVHGAALVAGRGRDEVAVAYLLGGGAAGGEVDDFLGAEDRGRGEGGRRVFADEVGGGAAVDLVVDGEAGLDLVARVVRRRHQPHVVHLPDADARQSHLGAAAESVAVREARAQVNLAREGRDVARRVQDEEDQDADGDDDQQSHPHLADS